VSSATIARAFALSAAAGVAALACSAKSDPSPVSYTLQFPSTAAAVYTDSIVLSVFDAPSGPARATFCSNLVQKKRSGQELGARMGEVQLGNVCEARDQKRPLTVDYGEVALLVVGQHSGTDTYIGCSLQTVGDGNLPVPLYLTPIHDREPPVTTCTSVTQFCNRQCP
jgi:hypothetical protein